MGERLASLLIRKMELYVRLSSDERLLLEELASGATRRIAPSRDLVAEGDFPRSVFIVQDGWAARTKVLDDGRRQIVSLILPGDICDAHNHVLKKMDHGILALTRLKVAEVARERLEQALDQSTRLCRAFWWQDLVGVAIQREWTLNVGQRSAYERIAHFLCETFVRLEAIGMTQGNTCDFPIVQNDLADITGLTSVHVNRTLQELRRSELILLNNRRLTIPDLGRLKDVSLFTPGYLHLGREGSHLDANA
jgi:CRP-like cAMP-binding protein